MMDPKQAKLATSCACEGTLFGLCHDGRRARLYGGGMNRAIYEVDLSDTQPVAVKRWLNHSNYVSSLAFSDGSIISAGYDRQLIWTDAESGEKTRTIEAHGAWIRDLVVFQQGTRVASVGDDMAVRIWDAGSGRAVHALQAHAKQTPQGYATALYAVAASPDGRVIASGDRIGDVCLWHADNGTLIGRLKSPEFYTYDPVKRVRSIGGIRSLSFSADGSRLAIAGIGQVTNVDGFVGPCRIEVWDWQTAKRTFVGQGKHKAVLNDVMFHPQEPWIVACGGGDSGGVLAFWNQQSSTPAHLAKPKGHLQRMSWDDSSSKLYAAGYGGFQIWDLG